MNIIVLGNKLVPAVYTEVDVHKVAYVDAY